MPHARPLRPAAARARVPVADRCWAVPPQETFKCSKAGLAQALVAVTSPFPGSQCPQGFVCTLWACLVGMRFDFKLDCAPPTFLLRLLLCLWMWGIFLGWDPTFSCRMVVQKLVVILMVSQEKMSTRPSTLPYTLVEGHTLLSYKPMTRTHMRSNCNAGWESTLVHKLKKENTAFSTTLYIKLLQDQYLTGNHQTKKCSNCLIVLIELLCEWTP